jgi:putative Ca2+/H+ antiporter (TMEM165/GDT1 family)
MKLTKVMLGITLAVVALNGIAVAVGALLASVPGWQDFIKLISSLLFLVFGLWSLKGEKEDGVKEKQKKRKRSYGEVAVVFASFFFSEMGDKTQLVTISLAARYPKVPVMILIGTSLGMLIADGIGIFLGAVANRRLPENALKIISASLFFIFGLVGIWQSLNDTFMLGTAVSALITAAAGVITISAGVFIYSENSKSVVFKK